MAKNIGGVIITDSSRSREEEVYTSMLSDTVINVRRILLCT